LAPTNGFHVLFLHKQGVDPSIRAEVWEFLLGCYSLSSTAEHRRQLRMARRFLLTDPSLSCLAFIHDVRVSMILSLGKVFSTASTY